MPRWQDDAELRNSKNKLTMEEFDFYRENIALLHRHFGSFLRDSRYFFTPVPFEVKYELTLCKKGKNLQEIRLVKSPIPIGALFLCWESYPELFTVPCAGGTAHVVSFNGSPLSGADCWTAVCLETGETLSGSNSGLFRKRCEALNAATIQSGQALEAMKARKGLKEFNPASLEELVDHVKALGND